MPDTPDGLAFPKPKLLNAAPAARGGPINSAFGARKKKPRHGPITEVTLTKIPTKMSSKFSSLDFLQFCI
jgi:hypothetical protein